MATKLTLQQTLEAKPFLKNWRFIVWDTRCSSVAGVYAERELALEEFAVHMEAFPGRYEVVEHETL